MSLRIEGMCTTGLRCNRRRLQRQSKSMPHLPRRTTSPPDETARQAVGRAPLAGEVARRDRGIVEGNPRAAPVDPRPRPIDVHSLEAGTASLPRARSAVAARPDHSV